MFYYLPLESYKERYTSLMSVKDGWIEDKLKKNNVIFERIEGKSLNNESRIQKGVVLDFFNRSYYSLLQNAEVVKMIKEGRIVDGDILYYDDFWTPGIEGVIYASELANIRLNIYAMLHAQSVDKYDFTYKLKKWLRFYEIGQSRFMKGIFVTSEYLYDLCVESGLENVYFGGLPYNKDFIIKKFKNEQIKKENQVIYSSRLDKEKNPLFFVDFADFCKRKGLNYKFVITTSAKEIRSNDNNIIIELKKAQEKNIIEIKTNLTKEDYYNELQKSKYQFNCALQDWLSWTLLEALTFECIPIYPRYRSFPEYLSSDYLYEKDNIESAYNVLMKNKKFDKDLLKIVDYFDKSFERYLEIIERNKEFK